MNLVQTIQISYDEGCYVLDGCLCNGGSSLAVAASNRSIRLYDVQSTRFLFELREHTDAITDVASTSASPSLLYSSQKDTGVMVTDVRAGKAVNFLTEGCGSGNTCNTLSVSPSGQYLAVGMENDIALFDSRTGLRVHTLKEMHIDEVTRVRFVDDVVLCSGSEDQMVNFLDTRANVDDDDVIMQCITLGEVATRITHFPTLEVTGLVGSCENGFLFPADLEKHELRYPRVDYSRYLVDWCDIAGELYLVSGARDEDGNATGLHLLHWASQREVPLLPATHREIGRIAVGFGNRLITGGEDGLVCVWSLPPSGGGAGPTASISSSARANATRERPSVAQPHGGGGGGGGAKPHAKRSHKPY